MKLSKVLPMISLALGISACTPNYSEQALNAGNEPNQIEFLAKAFQDECRATFSLNREGNLQEITTVRDYIIAGSSNLEPHLTGGREPHPKRKEQESLKWTCKDGVSRISGPLIKKSPKDEFSKWLDGNIWTRAYPRSEPNAKKALDDCEESVHGVGSVKKNNSELENELVVNSWLDAIGNCLGEDNNSDVVQNYLWKTRVSLRYL